MSISRSHPMAGRFRAPMLGVGLSLVLLGIALTSLSRRPPQLEVQTLDPPDAAGDSVAGESVAGESVAAASDVLVCVRDRPGPDMSVLEAVEVARLNDTRCGPPGKPARLCRALFVAAQTDPVRSFVEVGATDSAWLEAHEWALTEGAASSSGDLHLAFGVLRESLRVLPSADDEILARWVVERARPEIIEALRGAEAVCNDD